ncbi:MAG: restriction endonuclease subunit S [Bacteroidales bacterium]|nr:restriction endonuclease subunit S [Bacteroidales bacterium]
MKQGWEIKKLGEVCEIQGGSTPKRTESLYWDNGTYPWFTVEDIREQGRIITNTKQKITKKAWDKLRVFPEDTILLCCTASLGEYAITKIPLTSNQQFNGLTIKDKNYLSPMYLMHYCATLKNKLYALSGKATIDFVSAEKVKQISIPIPPLPEQERIVSELDLISGVIEKKKQQLKELDSLAQSVFYEMFGNPVENEKGWDVKKLGEVAPSKVYKGNIPCVDGKYWLLNLDMISSNTGEIIQKCYYELSDIGNSTIIFNSDNVLYSKLRPYLNKVVMPTEIGYATSELIPLCPDKNILNRTFITSLLRSSCFVNYISIKVAGAKMPRVSMGDFWEFPIILPPLPLQQEFASKIEKIEKQKELIKQSLKETETLFNSRMDFYFN